MHCSLLAMNTCCIIKKVRENEGKSKKEEARVKEGKSIRGSKTKCEREVIAREGRIREKARAREEERIIEGEVIRKGHLCLGFLTCWSEEQRTCPRDSVAVVGNYINARGTPFLVRRYNLCPGSQEEMICTGHLVRRSIFDEN
jgi:coenzyme F420-reducing hydrogenase gamma subunit